jgi:hypothetical protein
MTDELDRLFEEFLFYHGARNATEAAAARKAIEEAIASNEQQEAARRDSPPDAVAALAEAISEARKHATRGMDRLELARNTLAALPPGWSLTRNQDAAVLAYRQVERALEQDQGNHDVDLRDMLRHTFRLLSDHSAAADDIRAARQFAEILTLTDWSSPASVVSAVSAAHAFLTMTDIGNLATRQPAEGGDG